MSDSAFYVGPPSDPQRYRLVRLLGSGGEGEVWEATAARFPDARFAVKILTSTRASNGWEERALLLLAVNHPGLVRVRDGFSGASRHRSDDVPGAESWRYVVMDLEQGLTLAQWLEEHPTASRRSRRRILRDVAATLDDLHHGSVGHGPMTHGDVKPANIVIRPDGHAVLVDLGLLKVIGTAGISGRSSAFAAPELCNGASGSTVATDNFAFGVTALHTLTGSAPPLLADGFLDLVRARENAERAAGRWSGFSRRNLRRTLADDPHDRPRHLLPLIRARVPVTAVAAVATAVTLTLGSVAVALTDASSRQSSETRASPTETPLALPSIDVRRIIEAGHPAGASPTPSPTVTTGGPEPVLFDGEKLVDVSWRGMDLGCGEYHIAVPRSGMSYADFRARMAQDSSEQLTRTLLEQGSDWGGRDVHISLDSDSAEPLVIDGVASRVLRRIPAPAWIFQPAWMGSSICPNEPPPPTPPQQYRDSGEYSIDLDTGIWRERASRDTRPLGVTPGGGATIDVTTTACAGNYEFELWVFFHTQSAPDRMLLKRLGPFTVHGRARGTSYVSALHGVTGHYLVTHAESVTGSHSTCPRRGKVRPIPLRGDRETDELAVALVARGRVVLPGASLDQRIDWAIQQLGGDDALSGPVTHEIFLDLCQRAEVETAPAWREHC